MSAGSTQLTEGGREGVRRGGREEVRRGGRGRRRRERRGRIQLLSNNIQSTPDYHYTVWMVLSSEPWSLLTGKGPSPKLHSTQSQAKHFQCYCTERGSTRTQSLTITIIPIHTYTHKHCNSEASTFPYKVKMRAEPLKWLQLWKEKKIPCIQISRHTVQLIT